MMKYSHLLVACLTVNPVMYSRHSLNPQRHRSIPLFVKILNQGTFLPCPNFLGGIIV